VSRRPPPYAPAVPGESRSFALPGSAVAWDDSFGGSLGLQHVVTERGLVRGRLPVVDGVRAPGGAVAGGVYAGIADTLAAHGTVEGVGGGSVRCVVTGLDTTLLRPVHEGWLHAAAVVRHAGSTTWVWDVDVVDDDDALAAVARVVVAIRSTG
jgi:1,4-dihydroxy-2-naphthoyl-CoA hydrolase